MKPLEGIAAEKAAYSEAIEKLGRFAWGANRSRVYAGQLRDWLATNYGSDARFAPVVALLADYRVKAGQQEVADACRALIRRVEEDITGPTFPWGGTNERWDEWREAFSSADRGGPLKARCPFCGQRLLRYYYRSYATESSSNGSDDLPGPRGSYWEWCSNCFAYQHYSARVPRWWPGDAVLDIVPDSLLTHSPEFLERALRFAESEGHANSASY